MDARTMRQLFARWLLLAPSGYRAQASASMRSRKLGRAVEVEQDVANATVLPPERSSGQPVQSQAIAASAPRRVAEGIAPVLAASLAAAGLLTLYWQTAGSIVAIWQRSETFAHGFVVVPICLWLVWREREVLAQTVARPLWAGLAGVFCAGMLWLAASAAGALGVKQFALAFMIQAALVTVIGEEVARKLLFPLAFILFAVPAGEFLVPTFIDWTADFTVTALRWSGVPVYREANHFIIPSGAWSVVAACSGLRYMIASVMVGTIYAAVAYRSAARRAVFLAASVAVPLVANWLRAYMIVMIGHLSNNRLAVGVDHLIYGWLFFGAVMLLLFWIGSFWREVVPAPATPPAGAFRTNGSPASDPRPLFVAAIAAILVAAIWPPIDYVVERPARSGSAATPRSLTAEGGWSLSAEPIAVWKPHYTGQIAELNQSFQKGGTTAGVYLAFFRDQDKGRELVTSGNALVSVDDWRWRQVATGSDDVAWLGRPTSVYRAEISGPAIRLDVYRLYWVNGTVTANDYVAKALTAWSKLRGRGDDSALIVFYMARPTTGKPNLSQLRDFAAVMAPSIERSLQAARRSD